MKNDILKTTIFTCIFFCQIALNAQTTTTVNYQASGLNTSSCNVFNTATPATIGGLTHYPVSGGVTYNGTSISLGSQFNSLLNTGTAYAIAYPFKAGYTYSFAFTDSSTFATNDLAPTLYVSVYSSLPDPNSTNPTACGQVDYTYLPYSSQNLIGTINPVTKWSTDNVPSFTGVSGQKYIIHGDLINAA